MMRVTLIVVAVIGIAGCFSEKRPSREAPELLKLRMDSDARVVSDTRVLFGKVIERTKAEHDAFAAGKLPGPPVIDILIISGGGDWGAFGAGFLRGWKSVAKDQPTAMPEFDGVTGVSTGALIAPFAFVGTDDSLARIEHLYRNPQKDWVKQRGLLYFLPHHISFAAVPGLERELRTNVDEQIVRQIVDAGADGRILAVNTTNVDDGSPRVFDLVAEANTALQTGKRDRIHNVMLASAGIPGAFPFRVIDDEMYVDGGVTGNIIYGGRVADEDSLTAVWHKQFPELPIPKTRFWVLFNNQFRPPPMIVEPKWPAVIQRSMETSTRAATTTAIRHLFTMAEVSKLKRQAEVEVRVASIPGDWLPPKPGIFVKETMNELADLGAKLGADPATWKDVPP